jgi:hypothetical protein
MKNCKCNKLNPKCPPDISGEFNIITLAYGNLNGKVIPLEKPLKLSSKNDFEQNELFVKRINNNPNLPPREPLPGVWKKKYDQNLNFSGWELYFADSINDNGYLIFTPVCVKNNKVIKFTGIYIESGYMEGNPLQTPVVSVLTGVRLCKK